MPPARPTDGGALRGDPKIGGLPSCRRAPHLQPEGREWPEVLHLVKLCVGADGPADLARWQARRMAERRAAGLDPRPRHVTRMWPRRAAEIAGRGSLYWVFRGMILARQPVLGFDELTGEDGIRRCAILLAPDLVPVRPTPRRPFQGWRYLPAAEAPPDLADGAGDESPLPADLQRALAAIGVL